MLLRKLLFPFQLSDLMDRVHGLPMQPEAQMHTEDYTLVSTKPRVQQTSCQED
jgi:hypothetical protein